VVARLKELNATLWGAAAATHACQQGCIRRGRCASQLCRRHNGFSFRVKRTSFGPTEDTISTSRGTIVFTVNRAGVPGGTPGVFFPSASTRASIKIASFPSASGVAVRVQSFPSRLRCFGIPAESSTTPQSATWVEGGLSQPARSKTPAANISAMAFFTDLNLNTAFDD
jgi:hypothetical protein